MTCIVGVKHKGKVYLGGDSAGVSEGMDVTVRNDKKVFRNGSFIMGFTSSFRMGQVLAYKMIPPDMKAGQDLMEYMVCDFVDAARDCMKAAGYTKISDNQEEGGTFLVGFGARLFMIDCDFQVGESIDGIEAIGCGGPFALGSLYSTKGKDPKKRVVEALRAAENFSGGVRAPFTVMTT
jgi:ATP-dependent protease HslVU (ClpYQ) peptidase subunit